MVRMRGPEIFFTAGGCMSKKLFLFLLALVVMVGAVGDAFALSSYLSSFSATYPGSGSASFSCSLCHVAAGPPNRNPYGAAYASAGHNFKSIEAADSDVDGSSNIAEITAGTNPGDPGSKPAPTPSVCTSFTYSNWSACQSNNTQTRNVVSSLPAGCTGGTPVTSQACIYVPPANPCTSFTYSNWSACQSNNTQTRNVVSSLPAGCSGGSPAVTQSCNYVPPANGCTSFTYSPWSACQSNNTQTRTVVSGLPAGCTGGSPVVTQSCNYAPPQAETMPAPTDEDIFQYSAVAEPLLNSEPAWAKPIGLGQVVSGGKTISIKVRTLPFSSPVDATLIIYSPAADSDELYYWSNKRELRKLSDAVREQEREAVSLGKNSDNDEDHSSESKRSLRKRVLWKKNVTQLDESIFTGPTSGLESGLYTFTLIVASPDDDDHYYRWVTSIIVP